VCLEFRLQAVLFLIPLKVVLKTSHFTGTNLKIRSSSGAGRPRPSRFEVEK